MIRNHKEMCAHLSASTQEGAKCNLYDATSCGAWLEFTEDGVRVGSIVEGADFGTATYPLTYPFSGGDFQARVDAVEAEADAIWKWANDPADEEGNTAADLGCDAPDVSFDFLYLGPDGRSS